MTCAIFPYDYLVFLGRLFILCCFPSVPFLSLSLSPCRASPNCYQITLRPLTIIYRITYAHSHPSLSRTCRCTRPAPGSRALLGQLNLPSRYTFFIECRVETQPFPALFARVCSVE